MHKFPYLRHKLLVKLCKSLLMVLQILKLKSTKVQLQCDIPQVFTETEIILVSVNII